MENIKFKQVLRSRVYNYFKDNQISKYGNFSMILKTIFFVSIFYTPYILLNIRLFNQTGLNLMLWSIMGIGMSGIGLSIMHDANHGSYSKYKIVNKLLGYLLNLMGGHAINWKIQHNVLHHSYTNVTNLDEDLNSGNLMRFSQQQKCYKFHKYQHLYVWFFYCWMSVFWVTVKDFNQLFDFNRRGLMGNKKFIFLFIELMVSKLIYYGYIIVLPIVLNPSNWWVNVLGFFLMHCICGLILSCIFQLAHVVPNTNFPVIKNGKLDLSFEEHQLHTTSNFSQKSPFFTWLIGGLNYQIEHHLFPNICHIHYRKISNIVKETAKEFNLPYHTQKNFFQALWGHIKLLKKLGTNKNFLY